MKKILLILLIATGCKNYSENEIKLLIKSNEPNNLVRAFYYIGEEKDTSFISEILSEPRDPRIAHDINFKGISVYQSKMIAIKKISGLSPPREITYKPDSVVINFYCKWASNNMLFVCN